MDIRQEGAGEGQLAQLAVNGWRQVDGLLDRPARRGLVAGLWWLLRACSEGEKGVTTPLRTVLRCFDMALSSRSPVASCMLLREARRPNMFSIEWLHNGAVVDTETSLLQTVEEVIVRLRGRAPDSYRLKDASGNVIGVYSIDGKLMPTGPKGASFAPPT